MTNVVFGLLYCSVCAREGGFTLFFKVLNLLDTILIKKVTICQNRQFLLVTSATVHRIYLQIKIYRENTGHYLSDIEIGVCSNYLPYNTRLFIEVYPSSVVIEDGVS